MTELPAGFYSIVGILFVSQIGILISLVTLVFKIGAFVAKTESGIKEAKELARDAKDSAVWAHRRIDKLS
jgi:fructose-specific phosphotransferase system IIC component